MESPQVAAQLVAAQRQQGVWVVIAAFHEEHAIAGVVGGLVDAGYATVVVDDGSSDRTADQARAAGAVVLRHVINRGQGAALQTGIEYAVRRGASTIVTFDADGQHDVHDIPKLLAALDQGADIAVGSRFLGQIEGAPRSRVIFLHVVVWVSNLMSGVRLTDAHCGLRAFRASVAPWLTITQDRMAHASEILTKIRKNDLRVVEVPATIRYTEYSRRKGQSGFASIRILFDYFFRSPGSIRRLRP